MPDRRVDLYARSRIEQLEHRYRALAKGLIGMCALMLLALVVGGLLFGKLIGDVQDSRVEASRAACIKRNDDHRGLRGFIEAVAPDLSPLAEVKFPIERDCAKYAEKVVHG